MADLNGSAPTGSVAQEAMQGAVRPDLPLFAYRVAGSEGAPWITFVPGIGNDRTFWAGQAARLEVHYRTLLFDPWGHGDSPAPPPDCRFADMVEGLIQLWDRLGVERTYVVGLGFGGSVALATALAHPARVHGVVACCCRPRQPDDRRDFWRERRAKAADLGMDAITDMTVDRWLSEAFRQAHPAIDQQLRDAMKRTTLAGYQASVGAFIEMDFEGQLGALSCPVQLIAAGHDHGGGPVPAMQDMARRIPSAQLAVIPDSGHICVAEAPDAVSRIILDFMMQCDSKKNLS